MGGQSLDGGRWSPESIEEEVGKQEEWVVWNPAGQGWHYVNSQGASGLPTLIEGGEKVGGTDEKGEGTHG